MSDASADKAAIRELVDNWIIFSDSGDWDRFRECWHPDGFMAATWFQATADEFVAARKAGFEKGVSIIHFHGGFSCEVANHAVVPSTPLPSVPIAVTNSQQDCILAQQPHSLLVGV